MVRVAHAAVVEGAAVARRDAVAVADLAPADAQKVRTRHGGRTGARTARRPSRRWWRPPRSARFFQGFCIF